MRALRMSTTRETFRDTGDGFRHVSVSKQILRVDASESSVCGSLPRARVPCVAAAAFLGRVCELRSVRDRSGVRGVVIWHDPTGDPVSDNFRCDRRTRTPHPGEFALVFVRGDGVVFVEINTPLLTFADWMSVSPDVSSVLASFDISELLPPTSFVALCFWSEKIACVESRLTECLTQILFDRALSNVRRRFATRVVKTAVRANLEAIKRKLWDPHGRLVARMISEASAR